MEILQISSLIISLIGVVLSIIVVVWARFQVKENKLNISTLAKTSLLLLTISLIVLGFSIMKTQSLTIIRPTNDEVISNCSEIDTDNTDIQVSFDALVKVNASLNKDESITIFVKVNGGNEWWVSSKPVQNDDIISKTAYFPHVTIGNKNDGNKFYIIFAAITKQRYSSGVVISNLPEDITISDKVIIQKVCH
ncbi:MAG: hypothetical protein HQK72_12120 [Desulfamplus sp.]|nr:hypothetical protein [Desulfamplus sp.]